MFQNQNIRFLVSNFSHQVELTRENIASQLNQDITSFDWSSFQNYCSIVFGPSQENHFDLVEELYFSEIDLRDQSFIKKTVNNYISQVFEEFNTMEQIKNVPMTY